MDPRDNPYTPGAGTLFTDGFEDGDDAGWSVVGTLSKWTVATRGAGKVYLADSVPDLFRGLPETSRRPFVAVPVGSFDLCFGLLVPGGAGSSFHADVRPPRDAADFLRLVVADDGHVEVELVAAGTPSVVATTKVLTRRASTNRRS